MTTRRIEVKSRCGGADPVVRQSWGPIGNCDGPRVERLLEELCLLLHVRSISTSLYHPQTDGLVEWFNRMLEAMLRKVATAEDQDWDKWLLYVLFTY